MTRVTSHAKDRTKRIVPSKKLAQKLAEKALNQGIKHGETTGELKKFLDGLYFYNETANNVRIYKQKVFIFHDDILITIINLPFRYHSSEEKIKKKRNLTRV